ncbi:MAG: tRNA CCA-pyrophosphorylase [Candidatus Heimdallarchaeota archaeon]|nr:tRNA CCA-pyrophosphorylase [Candidatus Heimdallarchaeota archaeon]
MSKTPPQEFILTSGRTIEQGVTLVGIKLSQKAKQATAVAFLDPRDMTKLTLQENSRIKITTSEGEIVVFARESKDAPHEGIVFMPLGIYANWVLPPGSSGIGVPLYKGVKALIEPTEESVKEIDDLLQELMTQSKISSSKK